MVRVVLAWMLALWAPASIMAQPSAVGVVRGIVRAEATERPVAGALVVVRAVQLWARWSSWESGS